MTSVSDRQYLICTKCVMDTTKSKIAFDADQSSVTITGMGRSNVSPKKEFSNFAVQLDSGSHEKGIDI